MPIDEASRRVADITAIILSDSMLASTLARLKYRPGKSIADFGEALEVERHSPLYRRQRI